MVLKTLEEDAAKPPVISEEDGPAN